MSGKENPVVAAAVAHFESLGTRKIEVPEWSQGEEPLVIYSTPYTMRQRGKFLKNVQKVGEVEAMVKFVVDKALDANGERMFRPGDEITLLNNADQEVISRIFLAMLDKEDTVEDAEKK